MPTPTDDRRDLLTVIAYMRAAPGKRDELRAALEALIEPTSREKGYVNYDLHQGIEDPDRFFFYRAFDLPQLGLNRGFRLLCNTRFVVPSLRLGDLFYRR